MGSNARLIYSASKLDFKDLVELVTRNASAASIELEVHDADRLASSDEERFLSDIRLIPPQTRGPSEEWWRKNPSDFREQQTQPFDSNTHRLRWQPAD